ncbi:uncharacterized protein LOC126660828 [Mercurialis annua]|uniref:uncharacterized protein LOC126660828 n=1 Tax=Mercurialis annua TaxID=3986 RepID=UPI00215F2714|nr:uncharacterized protein LOC126660828 [Mercurialis annua]
MTTSIHITALDGIINVNSLFTLAVFLGLAWNPSEPNNSFITDPNSPCAASRAVVENLVAFHVYSFSSFLFSSLLALALKQALRIAKSGDVSDHIRHVPEFFTHINKDLVRVGMLVSGLGSVCGCICLMLALINVVQFKLGALSCGSGHSLAAVIPLVIFVPIGLLIYVCVVLYAFTR